MQNLIDIEISRNFQEILLWLESFRVSLSEKYTKVIKIVANINDYFNRQNDQNRLINHSLKEFLKSSL